MFKNKSKLSAGGEFRVVSGLHKGAKLRFPADSHTHPMGSREKLALFNMVSTSGMRVLDVYAGSGALGIEALSRGAKTAIFVEKSPQIARLIQENLAKIGLKVPVFGPQQASSDADITKGGQTAVFTENAASFMKRPQFLAIFDLILADPPYDGFCDVESVRADLEGLGDLLAPGGTLVLSSPASLEPLELPGLSIKTTRTYAGARITVYNRG